MSFEKLAVLFPLLLFETVIKRKKENKPSNNHDLPKSYIALFVINLEIWAKGGPFLNLLFVFWLLSNNIPDRYCTYFPGDSTLFRTTWKKETTLFFFHSFKFCSSPKWLKPHRTNMMLNEKTRIFVPRGSPFLSIYLNMAIVVSNVTYPRTCWICVPLRSQRKWCEPPMALTHKTKNDSRNILEGLIEFYILSISNDINLLCPWHFLLLVILTDSSQAKKYWFCYLHIILNLF